MATPFTVMTFNIRGAYFDDGENRWEARAALCAQVIKDAAPNVIGFQEMQRPNLASLHTTLTDYAYYPGLPNSYELGGEANYNALFWHRERFAFLGSGGFYLSPTPDIPSVAWDYCQSRVVTWVRLHDTQTGYDLVFANTHLPHDNDVARVQSSQLLAQILRTVAQNDPVVLVGDFNDRSIPPTAEQQCILLETFGSVQSDKRSSVHTLLEQASFRDESGAVAGVKTEQNTFHGFLGEALPPVGHCLDWILLLDGKQKLQMKTRQILTTASPPLFPSDHYPVLAHLCMNP